ncbi:MAG: ATP-binding protein [Merismopedia sp. SIO2A8]|nr:ATP-binding protein [Symploca sp. SIO2B6]NET47301.1 ATP-binding protein [Merismopedia sp. SIO2A8]
MPLPPEEWTPDFLQYPAILIYGAAGSGKTTTASWLVKERLLLGHQVKVLDPHRSYGQWLGLECIGDGMNYEAINEELLAFSLAVRERYTQRSKIPNYDPPKLTLLCDEFTQWSSKCSHAATFFDACLADIRKINMHVIFISHARTLKGLGGTSGMADARDAGLLELELEAQVDPVTKEAAPKFLGWLKYPGVSLKNRQRVRLSKWMKGCETFSGIVEANVPDGVGEDEPEEKNLKVSDLLNEPLKSIWLYTKKKGGWVSCKQIYQADIKVLHGKKMVEVRRYLGLLSDYGFGQIEEEKRADSNVKFLAY